MCNHEILRTVGDQVFCKLCGVALPLEFLMGKKEPDPAPAPEPEPELPAIPEPEPEPDPEPAPEPAPDPENTPAPEPEPEPEPDPEPEPINEPMQGEQNEAGNAPVEPATDKPAPKKRAAKNAGKTAKKGGD